MKTCDDGLRLIQQYEGEPRLKARLCEGGAWELSYGVTFHPDGRPVQAGETCTPEYATELFRNALGVFERAVSEALTVTVTQQQFSALVALAYNIGVANFGKSTVLKETNANRLDDAAAAFGMWIYATKAGHKQAYRGLLRRRYSEACLYLGYDWTEACEDDAVALKREPPVSLPGTDRVIYKTPFKDVLRVAQRFPLEARPAVQEAEDLFEPEPVPVAVSPPAVAEPAPEPVPVSVPLPVPSDQPSAPVPSGVGAEPSQAPVPPTTPPAAAPASIPDPVEAKPVAHRSPSPPAVATGPAVVVRVPPPPPVPPTPPPVTQQTAAVDAAKKSEDWSSGTKAMWQSRRFYGLMLIFIGRGWMLWSGSSALLGAVSDPLVMELFGGFGVMIAGEIIQAWGNKKATQALR